MDESTEPLDERSRRMQILEMIDSGQISAAEGLSLLAETNGQEAEAEEAAGPQAVFGQAGAGTGTGAEAGQPFDSAVPPADEPAGSREPVRPEVLEKEIPPDLRKWRNYWKVPLWVGVGIAVLSSIWMSRSLQASGVGFWFFCAAVPFTIGVLVIVLAAQSRTAHWMHLRVTQAPGERPQHIALSFPLPIGLATWFIQTFRSRIPGMENLPPNIDQILRSVSDSTSPENPIYIDVDEGENGEKVRIYIG